MPTDRNERERSNKRGTTNNRIEQLKSTEIQDSIRATKLKLYKILRTIKNRRIIIPDKCAYYRVFEQSIIISIVFERRIINRRREQLFGKSPKSRDSKTAQPSR